MRPALLTLVALLACDRSTPTVDAPDATAALAAPSTSAQRPAPPLRRGAAIAHGGVGSPAAWSDGCRAAVDAALRAVESGADPVDAAVAGVVVMEDDPRFNAGTGARVRLDAKSIQMDASVMRSDGRFGAVAGVENVKNPVKVARAVMDTPHLFLQGDGATRFARTLGFAPYDPTTPDSLAKARAVQAQLLADAGSLGPAWGAFDWRAHWNFDRSLEEAGLGGDAGGKPGTTRRADGGHDTVGVAVRAPDGRFGVALSTGGMSIAMRGRVGDVPILGAGLFASEVGAAAATGAGERIMEEGLAREVAGWLATGTSPQDAADRAVARIKDRGDIGIIVLGTAGMAAAADRPMAWAGRDSGSVEWRGPR